MNGRNLKTRSKSSLFLMELIIVLLFFSICAAICMRVFATSKVKTDYARDLSQASFTAETVAEIYKEKNGDFGAVSSYFGVEADSWSEFRLYYDKQWNPTPELSKDGYVLQIVSNEKGNLREAFIKVVYADNESKIFEMVAAALKPISNEEGV